MQNDGLDWTANSRWRWQSMIIEDEPNLTVYECEQLASALFEDAAALPPGPKKQEILKLAQGYRSLGKMKRLILRNVN